MNPLIIIQARLNSTRLPGKVLMPIKGKPMIRYLIQRALCTNWDCVIATPDEEICEYGRGPRISYQIGPEDDVAARFANVLSRRMSPPTFIRLCGDSPLMDPELIAAAVVLYEPPYLEIISPVGCVEVCNTAAFLKDLPSMSAHEREHVTLLLRPQGRTIKVGGGPRLVVDTQADFDRVKGVIEKMDKPHTEYGWRECCALLS